MVDEKIRAPQLLGAVIGARLLDVTQQDEDDEVEGDFFIALHFDNGVTLTFPYDPASEEVLRMTDHPAWPGDDDTPRESDEA